MSHFAFLRLAALVAVTSLLATVPTSARADYSEDQLKADLKLFEDAKAPHGDKDLLNLFANRLFPEKHKERIDGLIQMLSSKSYKEREQARGDLEKIGPPALPLLRKVLQTDAELEVKQRAELCIKAIEKKEPNTLVMAAARLLAHRQVDGALRLLMEYVALAPDDVVEEEISASIFRLALAGAKLHVLPPVVKTGKLDREMMTALADKEPKRRAIAALIVAHYGDASQRQAVAKLLADKDPAVRFRAAQGLASVGDKNAVPVLVELLDKGPLNLALQAEDMLGLIAQDKGPSAPLSEKQEMRQKCHVAWQEWWSKNKDSLDLSKVELDAPFGGMVSRASYGAIRVLKSLFFASKLDLEEITRVTDVPFTIYGAINFNTREEFDKFLKENLGKERPQQDYKFKITKIVPGATYLKSAPDTERGFLEAARPSQIHVVYVRLQLGANGKDLDAGTLPMFIRISGGRARCLGLGQPTINKQ